MYMYDYSKTKLNEGGDSFYFSIGLASTDVLRI